MDQTNNNDTGKKPEDNNKFNGYTLEDLRYQRALIALKKEFSKAKTINSVTKLKKKNPLTDNKTLSLPGKIGGMATRLLTGLNYVDYAMLGFSLFKSGKKIYSFFRRKKR